MRTEGEWDEDHSEGAKLNEANHQSATEDDRTRMTTTEGVERGVESTLYADPYSRRGDWCGSGWLRPVNQFCVDFLLHWDAPVHFSKGEDVICES